MNRGKGYCTMYYLMIWRRRCRVFGLLLINMVVFTQIAMVFIFTEKMKGYRRVTEGLEKVCTDLQ